MTNILTRIKMFLMFSWLAIMSLIAPVFVAQTVRVMGEKMQ